MGYKKQTLKCGYKNCKIKDHVIKVDDTSINKIIYYGGKYYHSKCFIKWCNDLIEDKDKLQDILSPNHLEEYRKDATTRLTLKGKQKKKENKTLKKEEITINDFYAFIREKYGLKTIPQKIKIKLNKVFDGSLPEVLNEGIPKEDFLDMWKKKFNKLILAREKAILRGIKMNTEQEVLYDITVLVSKYNNYLKWKEEHESHRLEFNNEPIKFLTRNVMDRMDKTEEGHKPKFDYLKMCDEIWGELE